LINNKKVIALIPARGGSKGLEHKNILKLIDKPLIVWTILQAKNSQYIDKIIVSTDSKEIADICKEYDCEVEKLRPAFLAQDDTPMIDVIDYEINQQKESYDMVVLLEPTSPLRKKGDIDRGIIELARNWNQFDSVISLGKVHLENPAICKKIIDNRVVEYEENKKLITARQQLSSVYFPYGVFYGAKTDKLLEKSSFYQERTGYILIERYQNFEIDDIYDFLCIESIAKIKKEVSFE